MNMKIGKTWNIHPIQSPRNRCHHSTRPAPDLPAIIPFPIFLEHFVMIQTKTGDVNFPAHLARAHQRARTNAFCFQIFGGLTLSAEKGESKGGKSFSHHISCASLIPGIFAPSLGRTAEIDGSSLTTSVIHAPPIPCQTFSSFSPCAKGFL